MVMQIMKRTLITFIFIASILLPSCVVLPKYDIPQKEYTVAVLPLYNATNDIDGPVMLRQMFDRKLQPYYKTMPLNAVDEILRDQAGVTLGGQLAMIEPRKLGEILGVDGLVYGYLLNFEDVKTVFYNVRKVRVAFKLVDTKTGNTVWARAQGVRSVTGMIDVVPGDERLNEFMRIKDIEKIPGINQWQDRLNVPSLLKGDARTIVLIPFIAAADTVLSLGTHLAGNMSGRHLYSFADDAENRIVYYVLEGRSALLQKPEEVPKLIFPAFTLFKGADFTARAVLKTRDLSTGEESVSHITLVKKGDRLRSDRVIGDNIFSVMVDRNAKKGMILLPESAQYAVLNLTEANFEDVHIEKVHLGEETIDGRIYDKFRVAVIYSDTSSQEGVLWESKDLKGLIKRVRLKDIDYRILLEMEDIDTSEPSDDNFRIPSGYRRIPAK
jgi:hypothetical protein